MGDGVEVKECSSFRKEERMTWARVSGEIAVSFSLRARLERGLITLLFLDALMKCKCKSVRDCSQVHQKLDWKHLKNVCFAPSYGLE